jgi:hypothetical protein
VSANGFDQAQREATHSMGTTARHAIESATAIISILMRNKKLKVDITSAKDTKSMNQAAKNAFAAGANKKEVVEAIKESELAQKGKNPGLYAESMATSALHSKAHDVAPQATAQKERKQTMSK